jgi:hypothetical protein
LAPHLGSWEPILAVFVLINIVAEFKRFYMVRILVLILTLGPLLSACASTTPQTQTSQGNFGSLCRNIDTNNDGKISREELLAAAKNKEEAGAIFDMCDAEKQGSVTYDQASSDNRLEEVIRLTTPRH